MDYTQITEADKLALAVDLLRGRESDHYRVSLLSEPNKDDRLAELEDEINEIRQEIELQTAIVEIAAEDAATGAEVVTEEAAPEGTE